MSVSLRARKRTAAVVLSIGPLRKLFDKIVLDERYLQSLIRNPIFRNRIRDVEDIRLALTSVILSKDLFGLLALHGRILHRLFTDPAFIERATHTNSFVGELLRAEPVKDFLMSDDKALSAFLSDEGLLRDITRHRFTIGYIANDRDAIDMILQNRKIFENIASDEEYTARFLGHTEVFEQIVSDPKYLDRLLAHRTVYERILNTDKVVRALASSGVMFDRAIADRKFVGRFVANKAALEEVIFRKEVLGHKAIRRRLLQNAELENVWLQIKPHVRWNSEVERRFEALDRNEIHNAADVQSNILGLFCEGDKVHLANGTFHVPSRHSLWTLLQEILLNEEYYFYTTAETPRILDCGAHCGLALYYFKTLYPRARITAFEPHAAVRDLAEQNIRENELTDIEILPFALADKKRGATFYASLADDMAGSLTQRRGEWGDELQEVTVQCTPLSEYLNEPIHLLKMDIEGSEDSVLEEAESKLMNIQHIVCEYHHGSGLATNRLTKILDIFSRTGFDVQLGKSLSFQHMTSHRPMDFVAQPYSAIIWAKNRSWNEPTIPTSTHLPK